MPRRENIIQRRKAREEREARVNAKKEELADQTTDEPKEKASDGSEQKPIQEVVNLKYPLDDLDYKGTLTFEMVQEETNNEIVESLAEQGTNDAIKKFEDNVIQEAATEEEKAELEVLEAKETAFAATGSSTGKRKQNRDYDVVKERQDAKEKKKELEGKILERATEENPNSSQSVEPLTERKRVTLYLPMALNFRDNVGYENADLGFAGGLVEGGASGGQTGVGGMIQSVIEGSGATITSLFGEQSGDLATLAALQVNVIGKSLGEGTMSALRQAGGVRLNPNTRALFKSVALREFAFQFKFIAKSLEEAEQVKKIIKFFREELYPEDINVPIGDEGSQIPVSVGYRFPKKFVITPLYNGQTITQKIQPCFLRDVSVVYNPTNQAMHGGDNPHFTEIDMSLAFTETRTLSRKDISEHGF
tara:strand:+ start:4369 stop:5628 length:1260 start_codon:yes stop_codon:yes gene_type:complete